MTIAATIGLAAASERTWDVVVVGAGPAGALAARQLARCGRRVLLVDKAAFPRWKVCGCCLSGSALSALASVGLAELTARCGSVPLRLILLNSGKTSATIGLPAGIALSRERFDAALIQEAIAAGADFLPETQVRLHELSEPDAQRGRQYSILAARRTRKDSDLNNGTAFEHYRVLELQQRDRSCRIDSRIVVAANGLGGSLRKGAGSPVANSRIGAGTIVDEAPNFFQPGIVYMACGADGYVGLVRLEDGRLDIAAAFDPSRVREAGGPGEIAARILAKTNWPKIADLREMRWRGTPSLTRCPESLAEHRLFAIGDAAGYIEPFTGEGMAWALTSAIALAPLVHRALHCWDPRWMREWTRQHRKLIGPRQRVCRLMARALRSRRLTRFLIGGLSFAPIFARPFLRHLNRAAVSS